MASVTPVNAGASDLYKSDTASASLPQPACSPAAEHAAGNASADDTVELSHQALQLLETSRLFESASAPLKAFNAAAGLLETQNSSLTGPVTLAPQPELAAALEQAYGLSGRTPRPVMRPRKPAVARPRGKSSRERSR